MLHQQRFPALLEEGEGESTRRAVSIESTVIASSALPWWRLSKTTPVMRAGPVLDADIQRFALNKLILRVRQNLARAVGVTG
jgi:hypothetical protein